jgi:hypothetical protein
MGSGLSCFRSKAKREEAVDHLPVRPHDGTFSNGNAFSDPEKHSATYPTSHVPDAASRRTADLEIRRYDGEHRHEKWASSPTSTQASDLTVATTLNGTENDLKLKDEGVDDPEAKERARKAEEARIKAEKEEQERLDFLQWM